MGELIRNTDWSQTPVGPVAMWPQSLRTAVSIMLNTHFPMYIAWGKQFTQFYNDGYRPILGSTKHPAAMGQSTKFTFSEIWNIIGSMFEGVMEGKAVGFTDFMLPMDRHGFTEECYFIFSYSPIKQEDGSTGGVLVTVTETTDRVLGERRLKTLRELGDRTYQCKSLADTAACILNVVDGNRFGIPFALLYTFDQAELRWALEGGSGIDTDKSTILHDAIVELAKSHPLSPVSIETVIPHVVLKDGAPWPEMPSECCASILFRPDQKSGLGLLLMGISPRLRYDKQYQNFFKLFCDQATTALTNASALEEERKRAEALAELDRAKTVFFSNISHEFRTPLTLMLGPLEEMLRNNQTLNHDHLQNAEAAHRNAMRLLRLVNTLLDFSKIESGRMEASFNKVDIKVFTEDIISNFRSIIENAGLSFNVNFKDITAPTYIDRGMWEKIVFNLLSNAFKYTLKGSITIGLEQRDDKLSLTVSDTGVGIPEKELPFLFERFHRVVGSAGRSYEGTGIGLSLVAELVKLHHGTIDVSSKPGEGTIFSILIPTGAQHLPQERINHDQHVVISDSFILGAETLHNELVETTEWNAERNNSTGALILIVDDNSDMIRYLTRILEKDYRIMCAFNGKEALSKIFEAQPDLVVSDIMMPVMDGVQLLKEIKSTTSIANIPVMLLSARAGEESRIEGYDLGADDYLVKPFSAKELVSRVKAQINISRTRSHLNKLLKQVFEQTPAAITIIKKENFVVEFANQLYLQLVGKNQDFIGRSLFESMPELKDQFVPKILTEVMETGIAFEGKELEVYLDRHGRREKTYFNFIYHPLKEQDDRITGVIVVCFEVSELVNAKNRAEKSELILEEKVRERTAELEAKNALLQKANQELEQFAYVASHDLQEPLRKIRTFASILQREIPETEQSKKYFEKIHSASGRMGTLIKDVLDYSRLASRPMDFTLVSLNEIIAAVVVDFELLIEERNAKVVWDPLPEIQGSALQLYQLFSNLVSNAIKFSRSEPDIRIVNRKVSNDEVKGFNHHAEKISFVEIRFEDSGIGFDQKYADQIFVIFQRLEDKETSGTGIGLALCKKIIENHAGAIRVESTPGKGSVFFVYLPLDAD